MEMDYVQLAQFSTNILVKKVNFFPLKVEYHAG
jgi:hypothetical protein